MESKTSLLHLPDETIQEILSYLSGAPKTRASSYNYPSPNVGDWQEVPDASSLAALARTCRRLKKLAQPLAFGMAGVYSPNYWSEPSFLRALRDNLDFCETIRYLSLDLDQKGFKERIDILWQCRNLQSLELLIPDNFDTQEAAERLGETAVCLRCKPDLITLRLSFSRSLDRNHGLSSRKVLQFMAGFLHKSLVYKTQLRCLQIAGLAIRRDDVGEMTGFPASRLQELVLENCDIPIPVLPKLFFILGPLRYVRSLRLDAMTPLARQHGDALWDEMGLDPHYTGKAPLQSAFSAIPSELRKTLRSLEIANVEKVEIGNGAPLEALEQGESYFPSLSHLGLDDLELAPLLARSPQSLTVFTNPAIVPCCLDLRVLWTMSKENQLRSVKEIHFVFTRQSEVDRLWRFEHGKIIWQELEQTHQNFLEMVKKHEIRHSASLECWYRNKRAFGLTLQRMELENESAEDIDLSESVDG